MATQNKKTAPKVTSASQWRKRAAEPVELPSGNKAKLRSASMDQFLVMGFIPNSLKGIVQKQINQMNQEQGKSSKNEKEEQAKELSDILNDEDKLRDLIAMYDNIACYCIVEPRVELPPDDAGDRKDEVLYTDEIDMDDKVFVFNVAIGGTKDLESFREQQGASVESVRASAALEGSSE